MWILCHVGCSNPRGEMDLSMFGVYCIHIFTTLQGTNISHIEGRGKSSSKSTWKGLVLARLRRVVWGIIIDLRHPPNRELYITEGLPNGLLGYPYFGEPSHHLLNCSELIIWYVGFISWISPTNSSFPIKCWNAEGNQKLNHSNGGFGAFWNPGV